MVTTSMRRAIVLSAVSALALTLPSTAVAALNCTNVAGALSLVQSGSNNADEIVLRVNGGAIQFVADGVAVACPGAPTVANTVNVTYTHQAGSTDLIIEDPDRFVPGTAGPAEGAGAPEVEIAVVETAGILSDVFLRDTDGTGQGYVIGSLGVNFNPSEPAVDPDITLSGFFPAFVPEPSAGPDVFDLRGGAGVGGPYDESVTLAGGAGNDALHAGTSTYRMDGGTGDDLIDATLYDSTVAYEASTTPVNIDLSKAGPQDGGSLGRDTLVAVSRIEGSKFGDVLRGSAGENDLIGRGGDDLIEGRAGNDYVDGGGGIDTLSYESAPSAVAVNLDSNTTQATGGGGNDYVYDGDVENLVGSRFNDTLLGTSGINLIDGGGGRDTIRTLGGDDTVRARDGIGDVVDCGAGADEGVFDRPGLDQVVACESGSFTDVVVNAAIGGAKRQKLGKQGVAVTLRCVGEPCSARVTAKARIKGKRKAIALKGVRTSLEADKAKILRPALGRSARRQIAKALKAGKKVTITISATVRDAAGNSETVTRAVTVKPAAKKKPRRVR